MYFERARAVLSEIGAADQAVAYAQSTPSGLLRINAPMSFGTLQLGLRSWSSWKGTLT